MEVKDLNIYQKLHGVSSSLPDIHKIKQEGVKHKVVLSSLIVEPIKKAIDNYRLFLECEVISLEQTTYQQETFKGSRLMYSTTLKMIYTFVNIDKPDEKIKKEWSGVFTMSDPGTSYGAALTYTEKYFLLKFFNVPTDEDDPDNINNLDKYNNYKKPEIKPETKPKLENKSKFNLSEVEKTFNSALNFETLKKYYESALELYPNNQKEVSEAKDRAKKALNDKITNEALQEIKS